MNIYNLTNSYYFFSKYVIYYINLLYSSIKFEPIFHLAKSFMNMLEKKRNPSFIFMSK